MSRLAIVALAVSCVAGAATTPVFTSGVAFDVPQTAQAVLRESDKRRRATSEEYIAEVSVVSANGTVRRRQWSSARSNVEGGSDYLIRFLSPPDVRGVGFLAHYRTGKDTEAWLYLPSMKRPRRIAADDREASFVGTSLSYEDLDFLEFEERNYSATLLAGSAEHFVILLVARFESQYSERVVTIRKDNFDLVSSDFFVAGRDNPAKRLTFSKVLRLDGYSVPSHVEMVDFRTGVRTTVELRNVALNRRQPRDRFTLQNLVREGGLPAASLPGGPTTPGRALAAAPRATPLDEPSGGRLTGSVSVKAVAARGADPARSWYWATVLVRTEQPIGRARLLGAIRLEDSSSPMVGPLAVDLADRRSHRSPVSVRELSLVVPVYPGIDVELGRMQVSWALTDGYSPADAFLPRDLSDPLAGERLPLWLGRVRGGVGRVRFDLMVAPTTTPWRLPILEERRLSFSSGDVVLTERPWSVPREGWQAVRVTTTAGPWDVGGWARTGVRPMPILETDADLAQPPQSSLAVPIERHFSREQAAGVQLSRTTGGWVVSGELGVLQSHDAHLGRTATWTIGATRTVRSGELTATIAGNRMGPAVGQPLVFDRALLPGAILAVHQPEPWGNWRIAWVETFHTVGGILSAELTRSLTDVTSVTIGADVPHGAAMSPVNLLAGGTRVRAAIHWSW